MFRNGFGYGYSGWGGYPPQQMQVQGAEQFNRFQNVPPQMDGQKPTLQIPWVNGEVGAQAYTIAPNSTVLLMDSDNPIFYIKTSDLSGKATIKSFKYEECSSTNSQSGSLEYVTKEEFEKFKAEFIQKMEETKI